MQSSTHLDHRATWNEVCEALSLSPIEWPQPGEAYDDLGVALDFSERDSLFNEDVAWFALAREAQDSNRN
jgi:hypothetical protein